MPTPTDRILNRYRRIRSLTTKRRAVVVAIGLIVMVGVVFFMLSRLRSTGPTTLAQLQTRGVIRVGMDPSFPPFEEDIDGQIVGYDVDLVRAMAERWGLSVEFVPISFDGLIDGLLAVQYDMIISAFPYDPRLTRDVAYSESYFNAGQVLVVRSDENLIASVEDMAGRRLAVEWGSGGDVEARRLAQRIGELEIVPFETPSGALDGLVAGQANAALVDTVSTYSYIGEQGGVRIVGPPLTDERYVIVLRRGDRYLLDLVDATLVDLRQAGLFERLRDRWF